MPPEKPVIGMKIASTAELSDRAVIIEIKETRTTGQGQSFKQNRKKDWKSVGSRQKEENKHKNEFSR